MLKNALKVIARGAARALRRSPNTTPSDRRAGAEAMRRGARAVARTVSRNARSAFHAADRLARSDAINIITTTAAVGSIVASVLAYAKRLRNPDQERSIEQREAAVSERENRVDQQERNLHQQTENNNRRLTQREAHVEHMEQSHDERATRQEASFRNRESDLSARENAVSQREAKDSSTARQVGAIGVVAGAAAGYTAASGRNTDHRLRQQGDQEDQKQAPKKQQ